MLYQDSIDTNMNTIIDGLLAEKYQHVVILSGAGVSTNSGIPDYRSSEGIFAQLVKSGEYPDITTPEKFFSREFTNTHPEFKENSLVQKFRQQMLTATPTASHFFAKWLHDRGILRRVFTQNIDGLYQKTGLPEDMITEFHGNYSKDTVVLYEDDISDDALEQVKSDLVNVTNTDLVIVMGTSLQVKPFCALPNLVNKDCMRVLVDIHPETAMGPGDSKRAITSLDCPFGEQTFVKFGKRKTTLKSHWHNHHRYPHQHIFATDTDEWATKIMDLCGKLN